VDGGNKTNDNMHNLSIPFIAEIALQRLEKANGQEFRELWDEAVKVAQLATEASKKQVTILADRAAQIAEKQKTVRDARNGKIIAVCIHSLCLSESLQLDCLEVIGSW